MKFKDGLRLTVFTVLMVTFAITVYSQPDSKDKDGESQCASSRVHVVDENNEDYYVMDPSANCSLFIKEGDMTYIAIPERNETVYSKHKRNARRHPFTRWPNATVPYVISSVYNQGQRREIFRGMRHWEDKTCIRFVPRTNEQYYIVFMQRNGCSSYVGRVSLRYQPQGVSIGVGCAYFPIVVHEIGHAIGFHHEQRRPDRDEHIEVIFDIIKPGRAGSFRRIDHSRVNLYGLGYDYASIMHYSRRTFSLNGSETIRAKDPAIPIGGARELSPLDIAKANAHYSCGPNSSHPPIKTVVPSLTLPPGVTCGEVIEAVNGTFRSPDYPNHKHNQDCVWILQAPKGYKGFLISFPQFQLEGSKNCSKDYVQVYRGASLSPSDLIYRGLPDGKICEQENSLPRRYYRKLITLYYHTDDNNGVSDARGLEVSFRVQDVNECRRNRCHSCRNTQGSYECDCRDGYYLSEPALTCFDINECAYDNGGCQHKCINNGGSYRCECEDGFFLQNDGHSCDLTAPPI